MDNFITLIKNNKDHFGAHEITDILHRVIPDEDHESLQAMSTTVNKPHMVAPIVCDGYYDTDKKLFVNDMSYYGYHIKAHGKPGVSQSKNHLFQRFADVYALGESVGGATMFFMYCPHLDNARCRYKDTDRVLGKIHYDHSGKPAPVSDAIISVLNDGEPSVAKLQQALSLFMSNFPTTEACTSIREVDNYTSSTFTCAVKEAGESLFTVQWRHEPRSWDSSQQEYRQEVVDGSAYVYDLSYVMSRVNKLHEYIALIMGQTLESWCQEKYKSGTYHSPTLHGSIFDPSPQTKNIKSTKQRRAEITSDYRKQFRTMLSDADILETLVVKAYDTISPSKPLLQSFSGAMRTRNAVLAGTQKIAHHLREEKPLTQLPPAPEPQETTESDSGIDILHHKMMREEEVPPRKSIWKHIFGRKKK